MNPGVNPYPIRQARYEKYESELKGAGVWRMAAYYRATKATGGRPPASDATLRLLGRQQAGVRTLGSCPFDPAATPLNAVFFSWTGSAGRRVGRDLNNGRLTLVGRVGTSCSPEKACMLSTDVGRAQAPGSYFNITVSVCAKRVDWWGWGALCGGGVVTVCVCAVCVCVVCVCVCVCVCVVVVG